MNDNNIQPSQGTPKIAFVSLLLGIGSLVFLLASILIGILVEAIGIVSLLTVVSFLALAAIICGIIARRKIITEKLSGKGTATTGLVFGVVTLFLTIFLRVAVFIFFIPWFGQ